MQTPKTVLEALEALEGTIADATVGVIQDDGAYLCALRAAFSKNYQVNLTIARSENPDDEYLLLSSLRGVCEDLIGLKFLGTLAELDQDKAIVAMMMRSTVELMTRQAAFFESVKPNQPVMKARQADATIRETRTVLRSITTSFDWLDPRTGAPVVSRMARAVGLKGFYDYLYAATSRFVHFTPRELLRMGWGSDDTGPMRFSPRGFSRYYSAFNKFYAPFMLVTFCTTFSKRLGCTNRVRAEVEAIIQILTDEVRWPELITHEELNREAPSPLQYLLLHAEGAERFVRPEIWVWQE